MVAGISIILVATILDAEDPLFLPKMMLLTLGLGFIVLLIIVSTYLLVKEVFENG